MGFTGFEEHLYIPSFAVNTEPLKKYVYSVQKILLDNNANEGKCKSLLINKGDFIIAKVSKELLRNYVKEHDFKSSKDVWLAMKEMLADVLQEALETEMDAHFLGYGIYNISEKLTHNISEFSILILISI